MKKFSLIFLCLLSFVFVISCKDNNEERTDEEEFKLAMEVLNNSTNITIDMDMLMEVSSQANKQVINTNSITKVKDNYSYAVTTVDQGELSSESKSEAITVVDGENVKVYSKLGQSWKLLYSLSLDDYNSKNKEVWELENVNDLFVLNDNVWVGNCDKLDDQLSDYIKNLITEFTMNGVEIKKYNIEKYDIILKEAKIDSIVLVMSMKINYQGTVIDYRFEMNMKFFDYGSTTFDIPESIK